MSHRIPFFFFFFFPLFFLLLFLRAALPFKPPTLPLTSTQFPVLDPVEDAYYSEPTCSAFLPSSDSLPFISSTLPLNAKNFALKKRSSSLI